MSGKNIFVPKKYVLACPVSSMTPAIVWLLVAVSREKAGLRPAQSPVSHWLRPAAPELEIRSYAAPEPEPGPRWSHVWKWVTSHICHASPSTKTSHIFCNLCSLTQEFLCNVRYVVLYLDLCLMCITYILRHPV